MTIPALPFQEDEGITFYQVYEEAPVESDPYKKGVQVWFWDDMPEDLKQYIKYQEHVEMVALVSPHFDYHRTALWLERLGPWHTRRYPCPDGVIYVGYTDRQSFEE